MDPLVELIQLLRPRATLWGGVEAAGSWGVSFKRRNDVLFCWVEKGDCLLLRPHSEPLCLRQNDFVLIRTIEPFTLASDTSVTPLDSEAQVAAQGTQVMRLGNGDAPGTKLHGGRFLFDATNEHLATTMLPPMLKVVGSEARSWRLLTLLQLNSAECAQPGVSSDFIIGRLMELILVEALRTQVRLHGASHGGLLAGLGDQTLAKVLAAMHRNIAHSWTVAELARAGGVSRSILAERFRTVVGVGPIEYLQRWRIAVAKDRLLRRQNTIQEIALAVGFKSSSAFSMAFRRAVGGSPKQFLTERCGHCSLPVHSRSASPHCRAS